MGKKSTKNTVATEEVVEQITPVEEPVKPRFEKGTVSNCKRLNIRKDASKTSDPICVVNSGDILRINLSESSDTWLKVTTKDKKSGYCMAEYVTRNS